MEQMRSLRLSLEGEADCRRVTIAHLSTPSELRRPQASPTTAAEQDSIPVMPKIYVANLDIPGNSIFFFFFAPTLENEFISSAGDEKNHVLGVKQGDAVVEFSAGEQNWSWGYAWGTTSFSLLSSNILTHTREIWP